MWMWRKFEKINWKERITKEEVLANIREKRTLLLTIRKKKSHWIGHYEKTVYTLKDCGGGRKKEQRIQASDTRCWMT